MSRIPVKIDSPYRVAGDLAIELKSRKGGVNYDPEIRRLATIVGSKRKRDITRKNAFMSQTAFEDWNEKHGGNYRMAEDKLDDDEIPELVVYDKNGKIVGVNGYTTTRSDWGVRKPYYATFPTRESRKGHSLGGWVRDEIYRETAEDFDEDGIPKDTYVKRLNSIHNDPRYRGYVMKASAPSPYNTFIKLIVKPAVEDAMNFYTSGDKERNKTINIALREARGVGWMMKLASDYWNHWVKEPILARLQSQLTALLNHYNITHTTPAQNTSDKDFIAWIFSKKEVKQEVNVALRGILRSKNEYIDNMIPPIRELIAQSLPEATTSEGSMMASGEGD